MYINSMSQSHINSVVTQPPPNSQMQCCQPNKKSPNRGAFTSQTAAPDQSQQRYVQLIFRQTAGTRFSRSKQDQKQPNFAVWPRCWQHWSNVSANTLFSVPFSIEYSNAVILNPSFSLALSRFLLTITTPQMTVRYACINRTDSPTDKRG